MPVPKSNRGNQITGAAFEAPFETPIFPYGIGGLDLASPVDRIASGQFSRLTNVTMLPSAPGGLTGRPGTTVLATHAGKNFHAIERLEDPQLGTATYVWGMGDLIGIGASGAIATLDSGFSGFPQTLLRYHPPLSGDPWMFVADSSKMVKVRADGLTLPIALPAPTVAAVTTVGAQEATPIVTFSSADLSQAAGWTRNSGDSILSRLPNPGNHPGVNVTDTTQNGTIPAVQFTVVPPTTLPSQEVTYYGFFGQARTVNLSQVGAVAASDSDALHVLMSLNQATYVTEVRIYFVCSPTFTGSVLPGAIQGTAIPRGGPIHAPANTDYYVKAFRPDDFAQFLIPNASQTGGAAQTRLHTTEAQGITQASSGEGFTDVTDKRVQRVDTRFLDTQDPARSITKVAPAGLNQSTEFGSIGIALRRGDFRRYGSTPGADWSTITGIIIYISTTIPAAVSGIPTLTPSAVSVALSDCYLFGGSGPDTMDATTQSYDVRYTNFDPRTGDESNPSPEQADTAFLDVIRTPISVLPATYGDANVRQRFYRRGGILPTDWFYSGVNSADGGVFTDGNSDLEIAAAGTLALDNYEPIPTVDDAGTTILAQAVPILLGPVNEQLFAIGDPYRPGTAYACKPGEPDHWPPDLRVEVCSPSEQLLNGVLYGGQIQLFSKDSSYLLYPNLLGASGMTASPAGCTRGLAGRWALCTGGGVIWGVAPDGVFYTTGGPEEVVSDAIAPLFRGQTVHGYYPIDFTYDNNLRLAYFQRELYFIYQDSQGDQRCLVYNPATKTWRSYDFADNLVAAYADEVANVLILGLADRASTHTGTDDNGQPISAVIRTGAWDWGRPREEKLFGDQVLDCDLQGATISLQNFVNSETVVNAAQSATSAPGITRVIFDSFGTEPQKGRNLATEIAWTTTSTPPTLFLLGTAITSQPDITINRVTNWDDLGTPDQSYVMGITLDANTGGQDRTVYVERDWNNSIQTIATLTVNHDGRHKKKYSWPAQVANQVRLRPDNNCGAWMCFRADWIAQPEPPRIVVWDSYFEQVWDQYLTGLDLYCDTESQAKTIVVEVDGSVVTDPATGLGFFTVQTTGRRIVHLTFPTIPPLRGHVLHFYATDANPGLLYDYRWQSVAEPSEQTNWNQPFTILGTQADKYVKAVIFEVDTFNQAKTVLIEADGVVVDTVSVTANGRKVVQIAIPQQLGRVWRFLPSDAFPSRLYSLRLVFDEEPFALTRWETQEIDHEQDGFFSLVELKITLKSSADVTLTIATAINQEGGWVTDTYTLPSTAGLKQKQHVQPYARKGVLVKYLFTCNSSFWLYQEESQITVQPWEGGATSIKQPFGNSDVTPPTRSMINSFLAAVQSGGGST